MIFRQVMRSALAQARKELPPDWTQRSAEWRRYQRIACRLEREPLRAVERAEEQAEERVNAGMERRKEASLGR